MEFEEKISQLVKRVITTADTLKNEEMTKNALVMPFISALGYDVFNPLEVVPEYSAPIGEHKDARVDYAILKDGKPILLIECKAYGTELDRSKHCAQLQMYFIGTEARHAILTDGDTYQFYTDSEKPNKMDEKPYMQLKMSSLDKSLIPEIFKLSKDKFDENELSDRAIELKYSNEFKRILNAQIANPDDEFTKFFLKQIHSGPITQRVLDHYKPILKTSCNQYISSIIIKRLQDAELVEDNEKTQNTENENVPIVEEAPQIVTTQDEWEGYYLVKSLLVGIVEPERVIIKDTFSYCNVLLDKVTQPLCRMYFNNPKNKRVGLYDKEQEEKVSINTLNDMLQLADRIKNTVKKYQS